MELAQPPTEARDNQPEVAPPHPELDPPRVEVASNPPELAQPCPHLAELRRKAGRPLGDPAGPRSGPGLPWGLLGEPDTEPGEPHGDAAGPFAEPERPCLRQAARPRVQPHRPEKRSKKGSAERPRSFGASAYPPYANRRATRSISRNFAAWTTCAPCSSSNRRTRSRSLKITPRRRRSSKQPTGCYEIFIGRQQSRDRTTLSELSEPLARSTTGTCAATTSKEGAAGDRNGARCGRPQASLECATGPTPFRSD